MDSRGRPAEGPPRPRATRPLVVGVLGGIASGKSLVARLLAGPTGWVVAADALAHEVLDSPAVRERVRALFGPEAVTPDGGVDRAFVARAVFAPDRGPALRAALESWTHPLVRDRIIERLGAASAGGVPRVVLDVPLLLERDAEHGLVGLCDALVFVDSHADERERRARRERGWPEGEVARREAAQMPLDEKRRRAHHVIENNLTPADLERAVQSTLERLTQP